MAVDLEARSGSTDDPLLSHLVLIKMEDVMDKLKLLNYEKEFCRKLKLRPIPRYIVMYDYIYILTIIYIIYLTLDIILLFLLILGNNFMFLQTLQFG